MKPLLALTVLGLALSGAFLVAAIRTLANDPGLDW